MADDQARCPQAATQGKGIVIATLDRDCLSRVVDGRWVLAYRFVQLRHGDIRGRGAAYVSDLSSQGQFSLEVAERRILVAAVHVDESQSVQSLRGPVRVGQTFVDGQGAGDVLQGGLGLPERQADPR